MVPNIILTYIRFDKEKSIWPDLLADIISSYQHFLFLLNVVVEIVIKGKLLINVSMYL